MTRSKTHSEDVVAAPRGGAARSSLSRRDFVSRTGLAAAGVATSPLWLPEKIAHASAPVSLHTLVILFLRGGCDGLSMVAPRLAGGGADLFYEAERQTPGGGPQLAIPLPATGNGVIGLSNPMSMALPWMLSAGSAAAHPMYQAQDLAFVHGCGFPVVNNGSHFFSQDYMEDGTQVSSMTFSDGNGWGGRSMQQVSSMRTWRGMGYSKILQRTLFGAPKTIAVPDPTSYDLNGDPATKDLRKLALQFIYNVADEPLKSSASDTLSTLAIINDPQIFMKPSTATYPQSYFGTQMKRVQQLIQATADTTIPVSLETVMIDYGGWDNHDQLGATPNTPTTPSGEGMHNRMKDVFESLAAFYTDLQTHAPSAEYTFVFMTEFGRRITANANAGVDHGRGSLMAILGSSGVKGGDVYTMLPHPTTPGIGNGITPGWTGLQAHSELQPGFTPMDPSYNLQATIDYRRVLGEILEKRVNLSPAQVNAVFPGFGYGMTPETSAIGALI